MKSLKMCMMCLWGVWMMTMGQAQAAAGPADFPNFQEGRFVIHDFTFRSGETLPQLTIGYTTIGQPQKNHRGEITNAILLLHGTSGTANSWFLPSLSNALYGAGQPFNAQRYYLIIPDGIGLGRSSKPSDGLRAKFPRYGYNDMVDAAVHVVKDGLHVNHLKAVVGTSMGGMQTWLFAERYPDFMDGAIAVASTPMAVSGRNMMWRQLLIHSIRAAPDWQGGEYIESPEEFQRVWPLFGIMTDGAAHLQAIVPTRDKAIAQYDILVSNARPLDANDMLYRFEASADYNPQPDLEKIIVPFLAINFQDDMLNPAELGVLEQEMPRVRYGKFIILSGGAQSLGHQNLSQGKLWGPAAAEFLSQLPDKS